MARNVQQIGYFPILSVRPAEIVALRELPRSVHSIMLPHLLFRPWLGGGTLDRAFDKISHAYPDHDFVLELDPSYEANGDTPVGLEILKLRSADNGYSAWVDFCKQHPRVVPCLLVGPSPEEIAEQVRAFRNLNRGLAVRIPKAGQAAIEPLLDLLSENSVTNVLFFLDFGETDSRYLVDVLLAKNAAERVLNANSSFFVALSSTSFPSSFTEISEQDIFERKFYNAVRKEIGNSLRSRLKYSDRGSARLPSRGGGGIPAPRIDLPTDVEWRFFRKDLDADATKQQRLAGYQAMAAKATGSPAWDKSLNIWGTQMIKLTELGSEFGITSPVRSTAARINIHLFRQSANFSEGISVSMEDDWSDD